MHPLAQKLLISIRKQNSIRAGDRLAVAVSGGADSVALIRLMLELREEIGIVLSVAHVNHKLRGQESDRDAEFVRELSASYNLRLHLKGAPAPASNTEAAARDLRLNFFSDLARGGEVSKIATAHTLDDQAETLLLRVFRGTGIRGLASIHPRIVFEGEGRPFGEVVRPLLTFRRAALKAYLDDVGQAWRDDSSNSNVAFDRNRVRHRLLPLIISEFGDAAIEHMSELAEIARAEEDYWKAVYPERIGSESSIVAVTLAVAPMLALPVAAQRRMVRHWLEMNATDIGISFRVIEQARRLALAEGPQQSAIQPSTIQLSSTWTLRCDGGRLKLERKRTQAPDHYSYALPVPGAILIPELALRFEALEVDVQSFPEEARRTLLNPELLSHELLLRNWEPGERYWPANTSSPKKIKDLLTDRKIKGQEKRLWLVAESEDGAIIWMRGFPPPANFQVPNGGTKAIWIREFPSSS